VFDAPLKTPGAVDLVIQARFDWRWRRGGKKTVRPPAKYRFRGGGSRQQHSRVFGGPERDDEDLIPVDVLFDDVKVVFNQVKDRLIPAAVDSCDEHAIHLEIL
jgi:hypothetical protein